jgi:hypothetical protein
MEKLRIASKRRYRRARILSGSAPHNILKMVQEQALSKPKKKKSKTK